LRAEVEQYLPAQAHDPSQAWCEGDLGLSQSAEPFLPEGGLVKIGDIIIRVCQPPPSLHGPDERVMRLFLNPRRVEELQYDKSVSGVTISSLGSYDHYLNGVLERKQNVGEARFGDSAYEVYKYCNPETSAFVDAPAFVYTHQVGGSDAPPPHVIKCSKSFPRHPGALSFCRLFIDYKGIRVRLLFAGGGPVASPLPVELFPEFAKDLVRVMEAVDVTDDVEHLRKSLPYWDQHEQ
jgi:hypothetical protein